VAAIWRDLEQLQEVWEWVEEKLTTEEISNILLFATDLKGNFLACGNQQFLFRVLQIVRNGLKRN
jgi:hypothetical protein